MVNRIIISVLCVMSVACGSEADGMTPMAEQQLIDQCDRAMTELTVMDKAMAKQDEAHDVCLQGYGAVLDDNAELVNRMDQLLSILCNPEDNSYIIQINASGRPDECAWWDRLHPED